MLLWQQKTQRVYYIKYISGPGKNLVSEVLNTSSILYMKGVHTSLGVISDMQCKQVGMCAHCVCVSVNVTYCKVKYHNRKKVF